MKDDTAKIWKAMKLQHRAEKAHRYMVLGFFVVAGSLFGLRDYLGDASDPSLAADRVANLIFAGICAVLLVSCTIMAGFNFFAAADADQELEILYDNVDEAELSKEEASKNTGTAN
jgi:hypothetical protein